MKSVLSVKTVRYEVSPISKEMHQSLRKAIEIENVKLQLSRPPPKGGGGCS